MTTFLYNILMTVADGVVLWTAARARPGQRIRTARRAVLQAAAVSLLLVVALASGFTQLRLLAYGIFFHGTLQLLGLGILWARVHRPWSGASFASAGLLVVVAVDAFLVEPHWLEVSTYEITTPKLEAPLRIAVVADFQTDALGTYERRVAARLMAGRPDLILMPGDYLQVDDGERRQELQAELNDLLREVGLRAPLGIFAVAGNTDGPGWPEIFRGLGVTATEETRSYPIGGEIGGEAVELRITALSLRDSFDRSLQVPADERFHIAFGHGPDFALGEVDADLLVAGHTHGGQVRLPWIGPLVTFSRIPRSWAAGKTDLPGGRHLVVSRGIGLERAGAPPLRFLCRPQLVFIDLRPPAAPEAERDRG